jgi:RimJ/RimL family protein N-acetyltransferase
MKSVADTIRVQLMSVAVGDPKSVGKVSIRRARPEDAEKLVELMKELAAEPNIYLPFTVEEADVPLEKQRKCIEGYNSTNSIYLIAELPESEPQLLGELSLSGDSFQYSKHVTSLGMNIRREWRNVGLGSELMMRAIAWAKGNTLVKRIELEVYSRNKAAIHLYEKFGFEIEGCKRRLVYQRGEYHDMLIMALLL